jgi:tetratricopeptide (TPR) repeat protein/predicted Ser/Thr protein kinase
MVRNQNATETAPGNQPRSDNEEAATVGEPRHVPDVYLGDNLGRYTVRSFIGAGGMGRVFSAYDTELGRTVALKLIRPGRRDSRARTRLFREAQALARLHHPNVVTVYDVGTQGDHVFVAMELIEGTTLTEWLQHKRTWRELQAVFLAAGRGLAAAHAVGIVHRDFKPANVIVGKDRVVVVDFGLARAGSDDSDPANPVDDTEILGLSLTLSGERPGTPLYMAPEQLTGAPVTPKADQYAFCIALRDAVHGAKVPGWLDQIIARGLSLRADDRYPSMAALLAALERSFWTQRRRRLAWAAAAVAFVAVSAAAFTLGVTAAATVPCTGADSLVATLWDDATRATTRASFHDTGRPYADDMFARVDASLRARLNEWAHSHADACQATLVRHEQSDALLDARMACLGRARGEIAALVSLLGHIDADGVDNAALAAARAGDVSACSDVAALRDQPPPPRDAASASDVEDLRAEIAHGSALRLLGRMDEGRARASLLVARARLVGYAPTLAAALEQASDFEISADAFDAAVDLGYEAARVAAQAHDDTLVARSLDAVAFALGYGKHRFEASFVAYQSALAAAARAGNPAWLLEKVYSNRATVLEQADDCKGGLPLSLVGYSLAARLYGVDSYQAAHTLTIVADMMKCVGAAGSARRLYASALASAERAVGAEHPLVLLIAVNSASNELEANDFDGAARLCERAMGPMERIYGPDSQSVATLVQNLGIARLWQRRLPEARAEFERAIRIYEAEAGVDHPLVALSYEELALVDALDGRPDDALAKLDRAIALQRAAYPDGHPALGDTYRDKANLLVSLGRWADARAALASAEQNDRQIGGERDREGTSTRIGADLARATGHPREAIGAYRRALAAAEAKRGRDNPAVLDALMGLSAAQVDAGDAADALATAERAVAIAAREGVSDDIRCEGQFRLARARWLSHDRAGAIDLARSARARLATLPYHPPITAEVDRWLASVAR